VVLVAMSLSGGIVGHLWPKAHGVGCVVTHVVVRVVLISAIGTVLVVSLVLADVVRGRSRHGSAPDPTDAPGPSGGELF
jgi:hypothetical protein